MTAPTVGGLFSGYGGLEIAVTAAFGATVLWHCEVDRAASTVLSHHNPETPNLGDITAVTWGNVPPVDILCGGFPCQDVSSAGKRAGMQTGNRSGLWVYFADAIEALRPRLVVIENVRGLMSARGAPAPPDLIALDARVDNLTRSIDLVERKRAKAVRDGAQERIQRHTDDRVRLVVRLAGVAKARERADRRIVRALGTVLGDLADLGYDARWCGLPASGVGAPHGRFRVFIIAWPRTPADAEHGGIPERSRPARREGGERTPVGVVAGSDSAAAAHTERDSARVEPGPAVLGGWAGDTEQARVGRRGDDGGSAPEDTDGAASGQRRVAAPEQAAGGRARADARRRGGTPPTDTAGSGPEGRRDARRWKPDPRESGGGAAADTDSGRREVPDVVPGREPDSPERPEDGRACPPADTASAERGGPESDRVAATRRGAGEPGERARAATDPRSARRREITGGARRDESEDGREPDRRDLPRGGSEERHGSAPADPDAGGPRPGIRDVRAGEPDPERRPERDPEEWADTEACGWADGPVLQWGPYEPAIRRWEHLTGRTAPPPTIPGRHGQPKLNPAFVEWMMGLPAGWVTAVPGLTANDHLKMLGNGVVPQQAYAALLHMLGAGR